MVKRFLSGIQVDEETLALDVIKEVGPGGNFLAHEHTVKHFRKEGLLFPRRLRKGSRKGELVWGELEHSRALQLLHNPRYAGAFFFGRTRTRKRVDGGTFQEKLDRADWASCGAVSVESV